MRKFTGWIVASSLAMAATIAIAQERREPAPGLRDPAAPAAREVPRPGAAAQISRADQEIAAVKLAFCRSGMEIAKLAAQKAESDEVKQFAAKMLKEHAEGCANLEKWAGNLAPAQGRTLPAPADRAEADERQPLARPAPGGALNWVVIQQQLAEQCLASAKQELAKKEGADFDKCFMFMAIGGHQQAVDADHVFKNHASPQFQGEVEECLKTASMHLAEAKDIMGKLTGESPRLTRKPAALPEGPRRPE